MNPIVVIGLVSVVIAGMYGTYDGLSKQAELAALHADMLARQHAEHSTLVRGEIMDRGRSIILTNNGPQPVELVQLRAYNTTLSGPAPRDAWPVSYELPPLRPLNLSAASPPLPPAARAALVGDPLRDSLAAGSSYRGVTAGGGVFEIEVPAGGGGAGGGLGSSSIVLLDGGGASASHAGGITTTEYYYAEDTRACDEHVSGRGLSRTNYWDFQYVYNRPFHTSSDGRVPAHLHQPAGTPTWFYAENTGRTGGDRGSVPACGSLTPIFDRQQVFPSDLSPHPVHGNVFYRDLGTTPAAADISLPVSGNFTAPAAGRYVVTVDVPVSATVTARYDGHVVLMTASATHNQCSSELEERSRTILLNTWERHVALWNTGLGEPSLTAGADAAIGGTGAGSAGLSGVVPVGGASVTDVDYSFTRNHVHRGTDTCQWDLTAGVTGSWTLGGTLAGRITVDAAAGDLVEIDGTVRLQYAPPSVPGATLQHTDTRLELGEPAAVVAALP